MGQNNCIQKCNFEDIQSVCNDSNVRDFILINTIPYKEQTCLIKNTIPVEEEEEKINLLINSKQNGNIYIFIYGKNSNDVSVLHKYQQLINLGFTKVYVYSGGLFEWLCLQDIYGDDEFPTTKEELDILKYKPNSIKKNNLIKDI